MKAGPGRPKGSSNKVTKALKDMILGALDDAGGQAYLTAQASENPTAFLSLIGKVLPSEVKNDVSGTLFVVWENADGGQASGPAQRPADGREPA